jgi:hypothetical protein
MANEPTVLGDMQRFQQAAWNGQNALILAVVPSGAAAGLVGTKLVDAGQLTVTGVYRCLIPLAGLVGAVHVFLKATFATGTVSSDIDTLYWVRSPSNPTTWTKKTAATGDGSLTSTVLQDATLPASGTLAGEQYAVVDITLATAAACTFTMAEFCGV